MSRTLRRRWMDSTRPARCGPRAARCGRAEPCAAVHAERADREKPVNLEADRLIARRRQEGERVRGQRRAHAGHADAARRPHGGAPGRAGLQLRASPTASRPTSARSAKASTSTSKASPSASNTTASRTRCRCSPTHGSSKGIDEVRGDYISYDAVTEFYQVIGGGTPAATPANPQGRVRAVIQPKKRHATNRRRGRTAGAHPAPRRARRCSRPHACASRAQ